MLGESVITTELGTARGEQKNCSGVVLMIGWK